LVGLSVPGSARADGKSVTTVDCHDYPRQICRSR
jgi:hypothetical protein